MQNISSFARLHLLGTICTAAIRVITLAEIRLLPKVVEDLDRTFDFSLQRAQEVKSWVRLKPKQPFTVIAGGKAGSVFLNYGSGPLEKLPVMYGTSEGRSGKIATNLSQWLAILVAIPYWRDLLKFSGGGQLDEIRKTALYMQKEYAVNYPGIPAARKRIMHVLQIPTLSDPIQVLHDNLHATDCVLISEDGNEYKSLFNSFQSADNPNWV